MRAASPTAQKCWSLPPHGGSGLKSTTSKRLHHNALSPSTRREWIEIAHPLHALVKAFGSPSTRREWIEIGDPRLQIEGCRSLPPHGGSGLKWWSVPPPSDCCKSPSTRREWIEIVFVPCRVHYIRSPSTRREWIEIAVVKKAKAGVPGLPPHGGSGLK